MLLRAFLILAFVLPYPFAKAQSVRNSSPFPGSLVVAPGINYYPHQWSADQWEKDLSNISRLGIEFINIGDESWANWHKGEGIFDLNDLEHVIHLAGQKGLKVVITLPINDPPAWIRKNYENMTNMGIPQIANEKYQAEVKSLIKTLAKKFGQSKHVAGWILTSLDKEQWEGIDRSQFAENNFQDYLGNKYGNINDLNTAWGMNFVGEVYNSFGEIQLPLEGDFQHPLMKASYQEYRASELQAFLQEQIKELSAYIPEKQWISLLVHEAASFQNPWEYEKLDFLSWSRNQNFEGYKDAFDLARYTAFQKAFFSTTGTVGFAKNLKGIKNRYTPNSEKLALYQAMASGNDFISPYRYRQPFFHLGSEPASIYERDGKTLTPYGNTYKAFIEELKLIRGKYPKLPEVPKEVKSRNTAILYSPEILRKADYYLESEGWDYREHLAGYHKALRSMGAPVTFVQGTQDFFKYKVLIVAAYEHIDENMLKRLEDFAKKGGNVIFTARSGSKTKSGTFGARALPEGMEKLIGAKVLSYDQIPGEGKSKISHRGKSYDWNNWAEILELNGSIPLATHSAQYYTGKAVASFRILSRGSISYFGFDTDSKRLEQAMVRKIFERMRISFDLMELGMSKSWKDGFWFAMNFGKESQRVPMDPYATILLGDLDQGRGGVTVWTEKVKDKEEGAIRRTPVTSTVRKAPVPVSKESTKNKKEKGAKGKKEKVKKIKEAPQKEKSLFEQTVQERKKKNN